MHLSLLFILSLFSLALASLGGADDIQEVLAVYGLITDNGPPYSLKPVFTNNVTLDIFAEPGVLIQGIAKAELLLTKNLPNGTITQNAITTLSISLSDDAGTATSVSYDTITYFGRGNLTGQTATLYVKFEDKLIQTNQTGNDGWRIYKRKEITFVCQLSSLLSDACVGFERRRVPQLTGRNLRASAETKTFFLLSCLSDDTKSTERPLILNALEEKTSGYN
ncbi:hypothetical protein MMC29_002431 [Sticta canariensis]|nr:hypothetical protein [Sticta canariensis]